MTPEAKARQTIDALLTAAGWHVCNVADANLHAAVGVAIREFPLTPRLRLCRLPALRQRQSLRRNRSQKGRRNPDRRRTEKQPLRQRPAHHPARLEPPPALCVGRSE